MKNSSSVIRMALAAMFTAICLGIPGSVARAAKPNAEASVPPTTGSAPSPALPSGAGEVLKMFKGGISKDLIIGYINTTALAYHLSADEIIHLQTAGLPQEVIKAMIERGGQLQRQQVGQRQIGQLQQQRVDQQYYQPRGVPNGAYAAQPPAPYVMPSAPAPPVVMDGLDYPVYPAYDSGYPPYYIGSPCYWPPVVIGGVGWGRSWGWGPGVGGNIGGGFRGGSIGGGFGGGGFRGRDVWRGGHGR